MKPIIGISMGDPAGIGPEITVKALSNPRVYEICEPVVFGDCGSLLSACQYSDITLKINKINLLQERTASCGGVDCLEPYRLDKADIAPGIVSAKCGDASFNYITSAIALALTGELEAVVTGPINKEALNLAGHHFAGHTEIFAHYTGAEEGSYAMMLSSGGLRVIHVTTHVPMRRACDLITRESVLRVVRLADMACRMMGIETPKIGVAGLNPHCSENGLFGSEERDAIIPAIGQARKEGLDADGPVPPDTVFVKAAAGVYDIVVAMYHDQGHIPLKLHGFRIDPQTGLFSSVSGINTTIGLPVIRTSVDHGTAFDKAGKNMANPESLLEAIDLAATMALSKRAAKGGEQ